MKFKWQSIKILGRELRQLSPCSNLTTVITPLIKSSILQKKHFSTHGTMFLISVDLIFIDELIIFIRLFLQTT